MKRIFSALIVLGIILVANVSSAEQEVRVSDYGLDKFISAYNRRAPADVKVNSTPKLAEKVEIGGYRYHSYSIEVGNAEDPVNLVCLVTLDGYISKIMLFGYLTKNFAKVTATTMSTLGLNETEYTKFIDALQSNPRSQSIWCSASKRYIKYELNETKRGINVTILSAYTN